MPTVKRPCYELFLDGKPCGAHFNKRKAELVKERMESMGMRGRVTCKVTDVYLEAEQVTPERRVIVPGS